jgi:hypothetical protein
MKLVFTPGVKKGRFLLVLSVLISFWYLCLGRADFDTDAFAFLLNGIFEIRRYPGPFFGLQHISAPGGQMRWWGPFPRHITRAINTDWRFKNGIRYSEKNLWANS